MQFFQKLFPFWAKYCSIGAFRGGGQNFVKIVVKGKKLPKFWVWGQPPFFANPYICLCIVGIYQECKWLDKKTCPLQNNQNDSFSFLVVKFYTIFFNFR